MELEIRRKIQPLQEKLHKLQDKSSSLQTKINKILIDTLNGKTSGKEYSVTKQFEDYRKELGKKRKKKFLKFLTKLIHIILKFKKLGQLVEVRQIS